MAKKQKLDVRSILRDRTIKSPTWGEVQNMAETILDLLGGPVGACRKLSARSFYTLSVLCSLEPNSNKCLFRKKYLEL